MLRTDKRRRVCRALGVISIPSKLTLPQIPKVQALFVDGKGIVVSSEQVLSASQSTLKEGKGRAAFLVQEDVSQRERSLESIQEMSGRLIHAQEEERCRIARELHDDINQQLAVLAIEIQRVEEALPEVAAPMRARLKGIWEKTQDISQDVQRISHQLHSSQLEHLGLVAALKSLLHEFTRKYRIGGQIRFRDIPAPPDKEVSLTLFRVAQEALRNVGKHSEATNIRMELAGESVGWLMRISDDGVGFDASAKLGCGLGMISMNERLRLVNGGLSIWSRPGLGTQVEARVPYESQPVSRYEVS